MPLFASRKFDAIGALVAAGVEVSTPVPVSFRGSLLCLAVEYSQPTLVALLLDCGADPNHLSINPQAPFIFMRGKPKKYWSTPLHHAVHSIPRMELSRDLRQIIQCLLDHGARIDTRDSEGFTAPQIANSIAYPELFDRPQVLAHALQLHKATPAVPLKAPPRRL